MTNRSNSVDDALRVMDEARAISGEFWAGLSDRPVARQTSPEDLAGRFDEPLPEESSNPAATLSAWMERAEPGIVASVGPHFFGFVVGGVTPAALGGDWLATALDQSGGIWAGSPAAAETELAVLRWLKELFHLPLEWPGVMTNGATTGNLIGLAAARQWAGQRLGYDAAVDGLFGQPRIPVIVSDATHASVIKALGTLGFGRSSVERIPAPSGRLDLSALEFRIAKCAEPVIVVATAGEVNTGQFDDLAAISEICAQHVPGAWLHVDAAFGLFAAASPRFAHRLNGLERADSVSSDAHKWLNVPYDSGFVFVRDEAALRAAFSASGPYLSGSAGWDADDFSPEMSRRFRALPAWCALKAYGRTGYRHLVDRCVAHASLLASWVDATDGFALLNGDAFRQAPFNVVCFRLEREGCTSTELDDLNRCAVTTIQTDGRVFITGTKWNGVTALRAAFVNWSTCERDVELLQQVLAETRATLLASDRGIG